MALRQADANLEAEANNYRAAIVDEQLGTDDNYVHGSELTHFGKGWG